jgi:hypothetical protein
MTVVNQLCGIGASHSAIRFLDSLASAAVRLCFEGFIPGKRLINRFLLTAFCYVRFGEP